MQSVQESKQELEASIRYAENAISSAKATIESMEFRQEMAKKQSSEQTGREQALEQEVAGLRHFIGKMSDDAAGDSVHIEHLNDEIAELKLMLEEAKTNMALLTDQVEFYDKQFQEMTQGVYAPTMPVIPKEVAIAIFREGVQHGVEAACTELDMETYIRIEESEYVGDFHITFERDIDLNEHIDTDWMRGKCGDYTEDAVIDALKGLCEAKEFECRIHGVDDQEEKKNE